MGEGAGRSWWLGAWRTVVMAVVMVACVLHLQVARPRTWRERGRWRQRWSARLLRALGIPLRVVGTVPEAGVIAGNHLTYLDILTFGAITDGIFVAKTELQRWPIVGAIMTGGGSIFIDRGNPRSASLANREIAAALAEGVVVTIFPEGTTSDGETVLPVHSPLFAAAVQAGAPVWPAGIAYAANGTVRGTGESVCYWGDMTFGLHVVQMLSLRRVEAEIRMASEPVLAADRRGAATLTEAALLRLTREARRAVEAGEDVGVGAGAGAAIA